MPHPSTSIVFRTTGPWGAGKGANLTPTEVDENFNELDERVDTLETTPPVAVSIASISVSGSSMFVFLDDSTELGPFTLPTAVFNWRGDWAEGTSYVVNDVFYSAGSGVYLVTADFESASNFDPESASHSLMLPDRADWHTGSGAPGAGLGDEGDLYLDTANGDIYQHAGSDGWSVIDNITGPTGVAGSDGSDGTIVTSLDDVPDVEYGSPDPGEGEVLVRRSGSWVPELQSGAPATLDEVGDVEYGSPDPDEGAVLVRRGASWVPEERVYDFGFAFGAAPDNFSVIGRVAIPRAITIPADFAGAFGNVEINPDAQFDIDIQDDGVTIGTISVSTGGSFTFTTVSNTEKVVAAGSVVRAVSPDATSDPEATIVGLAVGIIASLN